MPDTYVDIQRSTYRRSTLLFLILVLYYFLGITLLWAIFHLFIHPFMHDGSAADPSSFRLLGLSITEFSTMALAALLVAAGHWLSAVWGGVQRILTALQAQELDPHDRYHQRLANLAEEVRIAAGGPPVRAVVIPSLAVNAFAIATRSDNGVIGVTEGLLARLTRPQLQGVLAHEMAHLLHQDGQITTICCALFAVYAQLLRSMTASTDEGISPAVLPIFWPMLAALMLFTVGARLLNMAVSRRRESLADATAVQLTRNPLALAEALAKIARCWRGVADASFEPIFIAKLDDRAQPEQESWIANLFSTHPPLYQRITALLRMAHANLSILMDSIDHQETSGQRPSSRPMRHQPPITWWVWRHDRWQGPYTADQLLALDGLEPKSWVGRAKESSLMYAMDDPILMEAFTRQCAGRTLSTQKCPRCRQQLDEAEYEGAPLLHCHFCDGYLVQQTSITRIIARREVGFSDEIRKKVQELHRRFRYLPGGRLPAWLQDPTQMLRCPTCDHPMFRCFYTYQYRVVVDRCFDCKQFWFDPEELDLLQVMIEESGVVAC